MIVAALTAAVFATFAPALGAEWLLWDDDINLRDNPHLRELSLANLQWMVTDTTHMRRYVPLSWINWAIEDAVFGLSPKSTHTGNLVFHAVNTVLVFTLCCRILRLHRVEMPTLQVSGCAALAAAYWSLHPLRVEPVAWASGRIYCLTLTLLLISTHAYLSYGARELNPRDRRPWWWLSLSAFAASLLTYPLGLAFPAALLALDATVLNRSPFRCTPSVARRVWREKFWFVLPAAVAATATFIAARFAEGPWRPSASLEAFGALPRLAQAFYTWAYFTLKPLWPAALTPASSTLLTVDPWTPRFFASFILVAGLTLFLWILRHQAHGILTVWLCHLALLVPFLGLTEHPHYASDRYSLPVSVLWAVAGAVLLARLMQHIRPAVIMMPATAGALALAVCAHAQTRLWQNSESLFRTIIVRLGEHPYSADFLRRLGDLYLDQARLEEAGDAFRRALLIAPQSAFAHFGQGRFLAASGRNLDAIAAFRRASALLPDIPVFYGALGRALLEGGDFAGAAHALSRQAALMPNSAAAHLDHANALMKLGNFAAAAEAARRATELSPTDTRGWSTRASASALAGDLSSAQSHAEKTLSLDPRQPNVLLLLAFIFEKRGDLAGAMSHLEKSLALDPNQPAARQALEALRARTSPR